MKKVILFISIIFIFSIILLYIFNIIPHISFSNKFFHIKKYQSKYYATGYSNDEYGTCTDVVAFALKDAGYDIMELLYEDVINNKDNYDIEIIDKNIDFRRVNNLYIYFKNNFINLTTDLNDYSNWQGGDIVVFDTHIAIVSNKRNYKKIPFIIHHSNKNQLWYEEDVMENYKIIGHFRIS